MPRLFPSKGEKREREKETSCATSVRDIALEIATLGEFIRQQCESARILARLFGKIKKNGTMSKKKDASGRVNPHFPLCLHTELSDATRCILKLHARRYFDFTILSARKSRRELVTRARKFGRSAREISTTRLCPRTFNVRRCRVRPHLIRNIGHAEK